MKSDCDCDEIAKADRPCLSCEAIAVSARECSECERIQHVREVRA